jgi:hypothetical protein
VDEDVHAPQGSYAELVMGRDRLRRDLERARGEYDILKEQYDKVYDDRERLREIEEAVIAFRDGGGGPTLWQAVLTALAKEEQL